VRPKGEANLKLESVRRRLAKRVMVDHLPIECDMLPLQSVDERRLRFDKMYCIAPTYTNVLELVNVKLVKIML